MNEMHAIVKLLSERADVEWLGAASESSVIKLESQLGLLLPRAFKEFLLVTGGGGILGQEISGIESDDPLLNHRGTIWGDTLTNRAEFFLPSELIVIYFSEEVVWCLDIDHPKVSPVVSFDIFKCRKERILAADFTDFLSMYASTR